MRTYVIVATVLVGFAFILNLFEYWGSERTDQKIGCGVALCIGAAMLGWGAKLLGWI